MDKLKNHKTGVKEAQGGAPGMERLKMALKEIGNGRSGGGLLLQLALLTLGILFSRCHVLFGVRPLGIVLTALLPTGVWISAIGAIIGSLTLGSVGIAYGVAVAVTVLLRVIVSGGADGKLFDESLGAKMAVSVVGGFLVACYEIIFSGLGITSVVYATAAVLLPPLILFLLSGLFNTGIEIRDVFYSTKRIFALSGKSETDKMNTVFFALSALCFLFFITLSLSTLELFGISAGYVFASSVTIGTAKRFGPLRGFAVGFVAPLGISGIHAVSFALSGLGAGLMFGFGAIYSVITGGALLSAFSAYAIGLEGLLSTLPEYLIGAVLVLPMLSGLGSEKTPDKEATVQKSARDMVGTVALKFRNSQTGALDTLEIALTSLSAIMREHSSAADQPILADYEDIIADIAESFCSACPSGEMCGKEEINPCQKNAQSLAAMLMRGERIEGSDVNTETEFCQRADQIAAEIMRRVAREQSHVFSRRSLDSAADEYELISRLVSDARLKDAKERAPRDDLNEALAQVAGSFGFDDGVIRAFGSRRIHIIMAGEDEDGEKISSKELKLGLEAACGVKLGTPEYFRNGRMALMECEAGRAFAVECSSGRLAGDSTEISGDSIAVFETAEDRFFALISDGMGSGEVAKRTSEFAVSFLERALEIGASGETLLHLLNHAMRGRGEECSATVDIFELDLISGEGIFLKSGSAPSFVKRGESIFRIKSQTAPLGLMKQIDSEKIRVEVGDGDYVVMMSDGVMQSVEDSPRILELLSMPHRGGLKELVNAILKEASSRPGERDDMSVIVAKIIKI